MDTKRDRLIGRLTHTSYWFFGIEILKSINNQIKETQIFWLYSANFLFTIDIFCKNIIETSYIDMSNL